LDNGPLKIVAIDDNADSLMALRTILADAFPKVQVFTAWNGPEGIELARAEDPDVILLALGLPERDGYEVCRTLKGDDRLSSIPVVILTALGTDRESRLRALEEGADAFLSKPFDEAELIAQVRAMAKIKATHVRRRQDAQCLAGLVADRPAEWRKELTQPRQAEETLREVQEAFRVLVEGVNDVLYSVDIHGVITYISPAVERVLGYLPSELTGRSLWPLVVAEDVPAVEQAFLDLLYGESCASEFRMLTRIGEIRWVRTSSRPITEKSEVIGIRGVLIDITERKRAEEALASSEAKYRSLFAEVGHGFALHEMLFDAAGAPTDYVTLEINQAYTRILGAGRDVVVGRKASELLPPEEMKEWLGVFSKALLNNQPAHYETYSPLNDKHFHGYAYATGHNQFAVLFEDITKRKCAEEALRESEERFRLMFEAHGAVMLLLEPKTGAIVDANAAAARFYGYSCAHLRKLHIADINQLPPEQVAAERAAAVAEQRSYFVFPHRLACGEVRWVEVYSSPVHVRGRPLLFSIIHDITERRRAEEELRTHREQLRVLASELVLAEERERRRLAMSLHDHTCQSLVLAKMKLDELLASASLAHAAVLHGIGSVLSDTIASVRELTFDLSSPTLYKFGLAAALEELIEDKLGAEQNMQYEFWDDGEPKPLSEDAQVLLFQSVREVLINIRKHARAHKVALDIRRREGSIRISVTDDGIGFDTDEVSSLPARHHGFGLFSIRERLDCIGGALEIDSRRGEGSRFILVAPLKVEGRDGGRKHEVGEDSARG
jgi:PAS domain S-box-containing protein